MECKLVNLEAEAAGHARAVHGSLAKSGNPTKQDLNQRPLHQKVFYMQTTRPIWWGRKHGAIPTKEAAMELAIGRR